MLTPRLISAALSPAVAVSLLLAACSDATAPTEAVPAFAKGGRAGGRSTTVSASLPEDDASSPDSPTIITIRHTAEAPPLQTYDTTFTAIQGQGNTFVVFYENPWTVYDTPGDWFMRLDIPSDGQFVDENGVPYSYGEPVAITASIDPSEFFVRFGPHGSTFQGRKPAVLSFNTQFADLGGVDIKNLVLWYQPSNGEDWAAQPTAVDAKKNRIQTDLLHFSNYAVAWSPLF
jgi:hypothetical protein